jgi:glycosyltransferase involved in cell wall biosynthesis
MKMAILTWGLSRGAFANLTSALAKGFWNIGVRELSVVYLSHGPGEHNGFPRGVKLVSLGVRRARWAAVPISRFLRKARPDVLISMPAIVSIPAVMAYLGSRRSRTKLIVNQADTLSSEVAIDNRMSPGMRSVPWLARFLYPRVDGIVGVSEGVLDILRQNGISVASDRMTMIPNPVDVEGVAARSLGKADHPWIEQNGSVPTIVSLGRLVKRKDFETLITAFARLRKSLEARLIIFGEGPERGALERLVNRLGLKDVSFFGYSENSWSNIR